jgi:hypothetical protein
MTDTTREPDVEQAARERPRIEGAAEAYAEALPTIREVARAHGYAVAVHGSQTRDLDLIAAPWTEEASPPEDMVEAVRVAVGGFVINRPDAEPGDYTKRNPQPKPHGRLSWSIHLGAGPYLDLSVMPRDSKQRAELDKLRAAGQELYVRGQHPAECGFWKKSTNPGCDCGYDEARQAWREASR